MADYETTIGDQSLPPKDRETEVWLACFADVNNFNDTSTFDVTFNIRDFFIHLINYCNNFEGKYDEFTVFFHNLKFDGSFILNFLFRIGHEFTYYINGAGVWYNIVLEFEEYNIVFRDSYKILNFSLKTIAGLFEAPNPKGETPLLEFKPKEVEKEWIEYVLTDVEILAFGIHAMYFIEGFTNYTSASQALKEFKETLDYRKTFPLLSPEIDQYIRKAYRGGWTYVKEDIQGQVIEDDIIVFDQNSMYASVQLYSPIPYGIPDFHQGEPENEKCYVAEVLLCLDLKENYIPTLQVKDLSIALELGIPRRSYIKSTNGNYYKFTLTNYDLDLIKKHYDHDIRYLSYYSFRQKKGIFDKYILEYKDKKENAISPSEKQKAKIMLTSLYGKLGSKIKGHCKIARLEDGRLKFESGEDEEIKPNYIAAAVFITSIARHKIISDAQANYDIFLYSDTDSLHLINKGSINLEIDKSKFGAWKIEGEFVKAKYLRTKLYIEQFEDGKMDIKGAGMTPEVKKKITFDNFKIGAEFFGKKQAKQVKGGTIIYDTTFTIKEQDIFS